MTVEVAAIRFKQDGITLFTTTLTARDINHLGEIHKWNPALDDTDGDQGYQREVVGAHAKRIARFLLETDHRRVMPTAILLSARERLEFQPLQDNGTDSELGILKIDTTLYKVDGQHRAEGFRIAAETDPDLLAFRLPVVILQDIPKLEEVRQFFNVNSTAKRVRTDLADRLMKALGELDEPTSGWRKTALEVVDILQKTPGGPWQGRIKMPNDLTGTGIASQRTWTQSLKPIFDGIMREGSSHDVAGALNSFWTALRNLMPNAFLEPKDYVIQKSVGVFALHRVAAKVFLTCFQEGNDFSVDKMEKILAQAGAYVESDYWLNTKHGGTAPTYQGMGGFAALAQEILDVMPDAKPKFNV